MLVWLHFNTFCQLNQRFIRYFRWKCLFLGYLHCDLLASFCFPMEMQIVSFITMIIFERAMEARILRILLSRIIQKYYGVTILLPSYHLLRKHVHLYPEDLLKLFGFAFCLWWVGLRGQVWVGPIWKRKLHNFKTCTIMGCPMKNHILFYSSIKTIYKQIFTPANTTVRKYMLYKVF